MNLPEIIKILALASFGYLAGSLPFSIWITRRVKGVDVRAGGSKHATTTNTIRQAGWVPGIFVLVLDITKGFVPVYLAIRYSGWPWVVALVAALGVIGHCWPIYAGFRGGMGLAVSGGAFLAVAPLAFVIGLGVLLALVLIIQHSARASLVTGLVIPVVLRLLGFHGMIIWVAAAAGLVIAVRFFSDWNRVYRELWLDREG